MPPINPGTFAYRLADGTPFPGATADSATIPLTGTFQYRRADGTPLDVVTVRAAGALAAAGDRAPLGVLWKGPW